MDLISNLDAEKEIKDLLGENLSNQRILKELSHFSKKNYIEILIARKIAEYLNQHKEYYIVRSNLSNLYVNCLLGITSLNPIEYNLPFELLFHKTSGNLQFDFNVSSEMRIEVYDYLKEILGYKLKLGKSFVAERNYLKTLDFKFLIALDDTVDLNKDFRDLDTTKVIIVNILADERIDCINRFISKYGLPKYDYLTTEALNKELFVNHNIVGIASKSYSTVNNLLSLCDKEAYNFDTYVYIAGLLHGTFTYKYAINVPITLKRIHDYPTSREKLYSLCLEYGLSEDEALDVCYYARKNLTVRNKNKERWNELCAKLPDYLVAYLNEVEYIFPLAHLIQFSKLDYLDLYYKMIVEDYYEIKLGNIKNIEEKLIKIEKEFAIQDNCILSEYYEEKIELLKEYNKIKERG